MLGARVSGNRLALLQQVGGCGVDVMGAKVILTEEQRTEGRRGYRRGGVEGQSTTWAGRQTMCTYKVLGLPESGRHQAERRVA